MANKTKIIATIWAIRLGMDLTTGTVFKKIRKMQNIKLITIVQIARLVCLAALPVLYALLLSPLAAAGLICSHLFYVGNTN